MVKIILFGNLKAGGWRKAKRFAVECFPVLERGGKIYIFLPCNVGEGIKCLQNTDNTFVSVVLVSYFKFRCIFLIHAQQISLNFSKQDENLRWSYFQT